MNQAPVFLSGQYDSVLFDLDGTLVDTAPDMVGALQSLQRALERRPIDFALGRSNVSNGAAGLLRAGFPELSDTQRESLVCEYINRYKRSLCAQTQLFPGLSELLDWLDAAGHRWGVVTNKPAHLTVPLLQTLGIYERSAATVSGDTLPTRKPDPEPLLHACEIAGIEPSRCLYVGDASRDIEAGRDAGMATIAASYGYIAAGDDPMQWQADAIVSSTRELRQLICSALKLIPDDLAIR